MNLTKNFTLAEMIYSPTATRLGISNIPTTEYINNLEKLCIKVLQPIRDHFQSAVKINSGYRCPKLNKAIGGSKTSQHRFGQAADFVVPKQDLRTVYKWITADSGLIFDQCIFEFDRWIHISYRADGNNRQQMLRASKDGRRTVYTTFTCEYIEENF
jgi:hypothetical protein